ncbi:glycosyl transferase [Vibrio breoganii]|uniref:glycosyltransferase family 2 protein n=1 Tax=Vibrio breoganii TaxID=553239 RepID=UPI000C8548F4|nr:glycosyltransferase family 2 protein [Vibrio breoganii]PMG36165.1 glycosyl transferase [Vibrio breoganii]PMG74951.1 glycosyl transferase [Vibrio breoganii]PMM49062.1 glycosyl transferase [Vibrio breoganii]
MEKEISVIILTLNEEQHIKRCIESLLPITTNIFIVDSFSTDGTVEIAESLGAKVYQNPWPGNHAKQFQWGLDNCPIETKWVMKMDADEFILPELADEINSNLTSVNTETSGIYIKRRVNFMGRWIKYGGYYPTWLLRIWRYKDGVMEQRWMDEHIKLTSGNTIQFVNDIVDDNKNDLTWWTTKHNNYSTKEAVDILNTIYGFKRYDEVEPNLFGTQEQRKRKLKHIYARMPLFLRPFIYFIFRYFIKFGFLDGKQGLIWHFLQGFWYRFLVDAKINEIYSKAGKNKEDIQKVLKDEYGIEF